MKSVNKVLEFDKIVKQVVEHALSEEAKEKISYLSPLVDLSIIDRHLNEVTEARRITDSNYRAPIGNLKGVSDLIKKIETEALSWYKKYKKDNAGERNRFSE